MIRLPILPLLAAFALLFAGCSEESTSPESGSNDEPTATTRPAETAADDDGDSDASGDSPEQTVEYQLAVIHEGGFVPEDDPLVAQFDRLLDELEGYCPDARRMIGDMGVRANQLILENGGFETLLDTFSNVATVLSEGGSAAVGDSCSEVFALWVVTATSQS